MATLKTLARGDPGLQLLEDPESGELVLAGAGELQLQVLAVEASRASGVKVSLAPPTITYRESVSLADAAAAVPQLAKSQNKHNRLFTAASAVGEELVAALQDLYKVEGAAALVVPRGGFQAAASGKPSKRGQAAAAGAGGQAVATLHPLQALLMRHGWSKASTQRVWAAGPVDGLPGCGTCLLVNAATGVANLPAIRDSIVSAFQQVCASGGVLANQRLRGVRFDITDAKVHSDGRECMCVCGCELQGESHAWNVLPTPTTAHRGASQVVAMASRSFRAAQLAAKPLLLEPM